MDNNSVCAGTKRSLSSTTEQNECPNNSSQRMRTDIGPMMEIDDNDVNQWNRLFEFLVTYSTNCHTCAVPYDYTCVDDATGMHIPLGMWLAKQFEMHRLRLLAPTRVKQIQGLVDQGLLDWSHGKKQLIEIAKKGSARESANMLTVPTVPDRIFNHNKDNNSTNNRSSGFFNTSTTTNISVPTAMSCTGCSSSSIAAEVAAVGSSNLFFPPTTSSSSSSSSSSSPGHVAVQSSSHLGQDYDSVHNREGGAYCGEAYDILDIGATQLMEAANLAAAELEEQEAEEENEIEEQQEQEQQEEENQEEEESMGQGNSLDEHASSSSLPLPADQAWSQRYQSLLKFGSEYGHYNVPPGREYPLPCGNTCKLGRWLSMQRKAKRGGNMDPEKLQLLQELANAGHMGALKWSGKANESSLEVNTLTEIVLNNLVTLSRPDAASSSSASSSSSSSQHPAGLVAELTQILATASNYLNHHDWLKSFEAMLRYGNEHGTCNVPSRVEYQLHDGTMCKLGRWLDRQRERQHAGKLQEGRSQLFQILIDRHRFKWCIGTTKPLNATTMAAKVEDDEEWNIMYDSLQQYGTTRDGTYNVKKSFSHLLEDPAKYARHSTGYNKETIGLFRIMTDNGVTMLIGKWLFQQRDKYERGLLRNDRFNRLQSLVNEGLLHWDVKKRQINPKISEDVENIWNNHYETLLAYGREHGHYNVPQKCIYTENDGNEFGLGQWLHKQKFQKQSGQLTETRDAKMRHLAHGGKLTWPSGPESQQYHQQPSSQPPYQQHQQQQHYHQSSQGHQASLMCYQPLPIQPLPLPKVTGQRCRPHGGWHP